MSTTNRLTTTILRPASLLAGLFFAAVSFVSAAPAGAQATISASTLQVTITADHKGTVDLQTGEVTVSGTITCSSPSNAFVTAIARQDRGSHHAEGGLGYNLDCSPTPVPWQATFTPGTVDQFKPGRADLAAAAYVYDYEAETVVIANDDGAVILNRR